MVSRDLKHEDTFAHYAGEGKNGKLDREVKGQTRKRLT